MRLALMLFLIFLTGCETMENLLAKADAANSSADAAPRAEPAPAGAIKPVRSDQDLASFKIENTGYADEKKNFGTPPVSALINPEYHGGTPTTLAGGKLISTYGLHRMLTQKSKSQPVVINALQGPATELMPGSVWLSGAGSAGRFNDDTQKRLAQHLQSLTDGDKKRALVFYCLDVNCWLSYNAALRAVTAGYRNVYWYRGGLRAWYAAGLPSEMSRDDNW